MIDSRVPRLRDEPSCGHSIPKALGYLDLGSCGNRVGPACMLTGTPVNGVVT